MAQPHLNFRDIGIMLQGVSRGRCPQPVYAQAVDLDAGDTSPVRHDCVQPIRGNTLRTV